jgi:hypothetical protein
MWVAFSSPAAAMMKSKTKKSSRIDFMVGWNDRLKVGGFWKMGVGFLGNSFLAERGTPAISS